MEDFKEIEIYSMAFIDHSENASRVVIAHITTLDDRTVYGVMEVNGFGGQASTNLRRFEQNRQHARYFFTKSVATAHAEAYVKYLNDYMVEQDYLDMNTGYNYTECMNMVNI